MPPRPTVVVDPSFPDRLRALRMERGLSYRALGQLTAYSHVWLWEIETGRKQPTPQMAARLDEVLSTGGTLGRLIASLNAPLDPDDEDRLDAVARHPRTVDHAAITSLSTILAEHRRLEDSVGSAALLRAVAAHLAMVEALVIDARSPLRASVVDMAAQWAQFAGWLSANTHDDCNARRWYSRALEWATEIGNANMISTALNMTGHLEWMAGNIGPVIGLSEAAGRQPASPGVRALAVQQQARGHALVGEGDNTDRMLDQAVMLTALAVEHPDDEPPWVYFYNPNYLTLQRGLAYRYLGRLDRAVQLLTDGLTAAPEQSRRSEWVGTYVYQLARTHADAGDQDAALAVLVEVDAIAATTGSTRLRRLAGKLRQRMGVDGG